MKAAVLHQFGQPLSIEVIPTPAPAPDEVLLKVEACGVCHSDLHIVQSDWPGTVASLELPAILGHEVVGQVVEKGTAVNGVQVGDRVGVGWLHWTCGKCEHCQEGHENVCLERRITGIAAPGGYAEYMRAKASHAIRVPDRLAAEEAAPYYCAGVTVYHACKDAGIQMGQRVAIFGVGGLGHLALQLAKHFGAETTAVDLSDDKLERARSLGAHRTINAASTDAASQLAAQGGVHVAMVTAPSKAAYDLAFCSLRPRGTLVVVGLPKDDLTFLADDLADGEFRIVGSAVGTRNDVRDILDLAAAGRLHCSIETCRLEDINRVFDRMRRGEIAGRAVVTF